jgi:ABC-2 type transport system permease protein
MSSLLLIWELARKDLMLFVADRRGVVLCFAVPIILASVFGAVFHRADASENIRPRVLVVVEGESPRLAHISEALCASPQLDARRSDAGAARRWLAEESAGIVVVLPADLGRASMADLTGSKAKARVGFWQHPNSQIEGRWVEGILTEIVMRELAREFLAPLAGLTGGQRLDRLERPFEIDRQTEAAGGALAVHAFSHSFCGMTLQYLLFLGLDSGLLFLRERRQGIWLRMRCAPIDFSVLLAGKAFATAIVALAQIVVTFGVGAIFFGVRVNGSWPGFVLMAMSAALLSAATGLVVASLGGNETRARSVSILVILTLSLLGGLWLPAFLLPGWVRTFALALPTTWAARGLEGVVWQGMTFAAAWPCALALVGFSAAFLLFAYWRLRGSEMPSHVPA